MTETFESLPDLASRRVRGKVVYATDDFFAAKENLIAPTEAIFLPDKYVATGKWMDGWESRRRRTPGHDHCIVRLGMPGVIHGVVVDTAHFRGNFPAACSLEAATIPGYPSVDELLAFDDWRELLPHSELAGDSKNRFVIDPDAHPQRFTHLRFHIYPDGGVARLRVHGWPVADWSALARTESEFDLAALENGALVTACSDEFFGSGHNLIKPERAVNMGDGWETVRRRSPGHEHSVIWLATEGTIRRIVVDTTWFLGNSPASVWVETCLAPGEETPGDDTTWQTLLPETKVLPDTIHTFETHARQPASHARLCINPEGGIARLRLFGRPTDHGWQHAGLKKFNALTRDECEATLMTTCGARLWAHAVAAERPFHSRDDLFATADRLWNKFGKEVWREAFDHHPRIGEKKAQAGQTETEAAMSADEQAGVTSADAAIKAKIASGNRTYEEKFGHIFLICARGKSAAEILQDLEKRLDNDPATELEVAAEEQRQIMNLRLQEVLRP